jgi:cytochrome c-type biogenesis protein
MLDGPYALAVAAGMAATVNPCGFALLPAYLGAFLGTDNRAGGANAVGRALAVSGALPAGFVVVFGLFGLVVAPLAVSLDEHLPWVTIVVGISLVGLGIALLAGRQLTLRIPKLQAGGRDGTLPSMFLFGVSYAVASLSCTIGPFLAVTTSTFRSSSIVAGVGVFLAYALGMGIVIGILTVALALAKTSVVHRFRRALPVVNRVAGALLVVAGAYVAYYGWYEIRVFRGDTEDPIIDRAVALQAWLQNRIVPDDPARVAVLAVTVLVAVGLAAAWRRRRAGTRPPAEAAAPEDDPAAAPSGAPTA